MPLYLNGIEQPPYDLLPSILDSVVGVHRSLSEGWIQGSGLDYVTWGYTDPATGTGWLIATSGAYRPISSVPNANETCRLRGNHPWVLGPDTIGTNTMVKRLLFEFEMKLTNVANIDNSASVFGLLTAAADTRASQNIIAFGLNTDSLASVTDNAGTETQTASLTATLTNWNKFTIDVRPGKVLFKVNEVTLATHITNLPDVPWYPHWYVDTEAGGAATIAIGMVGLRQEFVTR